MTKTEFKEFLLRNNIIIKRGKRQAWKQYCLAVYKWEFKLETGGQTIIDFMQPRITAMFGIHAADAYDAAYARAERRYNKWPASDKANREAVTERRVAEYLGGKR
jgi:hypothetical protein